MASWNYNVDLDIHATKIIDIINDFTVYCLAKTTICVLRDQFKFYEKDFSGTIYADEKTFLVKYSFQKDPQGILISLDV